MGNRRVRFRNPLTQSSRTTGSELFLHLYGDTHRKLVELRSRSFNFNCLGKERGLVGMLNTKIFARRLRRMFPEAQFDDRLLKTVSTLDSFGMQTKVGGAPGSSYASRTQDMSNEEGVFTASKLLAIQFLGR